MTLVAKLLVLDGNRVHGICGDADVTGARGEVRIKLVELLAHAAGREAGITFNDESSAIQAAISGQGVALLSRALVATELASGALLQPFGPVLDGWRYDLVYPAGAEQRPAVAALRSWVMAEFSPLSSDQLP
jgi:DNA-binding transcriptional LysR family regulator